MNNQKKSKKEMKVINVPKKKRPLVTPSRIIRVFLIILCIGCILLLSSPFLDVTLYITDDLNITTSFENSYHVLASQSDINSADTDLKNALDNLEPLAVQNDENSSQSSQSSAQNEEWVSTFFTDYRFQYARDVDVESIVSHIQQARSVNRDDYTSQSVENLNKAVLNAQKILCTYVRLRQSAFQLAFGGTVAESMGVTTTLGRNIYHSLLAIVLVTVPFICFFALCFDKTRHIKHFICLIGGGICLLDIFLTLYPYVGMGAVLSVILYIIILVLNFASIYAKQQEDYIVRHPELEPEFTEKHPQFVKALINYKAFNPQYQQPTQKNKPKKKK